MEEYKELEDVQKKILEIFKEIDKLCKKNDIKYYAIGGTCLGAVRHKGFIPWDDDLDIAIPRNDYERFLNIAEKELPENLKVIRPGEMENYECMFSKVHDINTTFIQKNIVNYPKRYTGIYIDIMPLDGLPDNKKEREKHFKKLQKYGDLNINRNRQPKDIHKGFKLLIWGAIKPIIDIVDYGFFSRKYNEEMKKYDYNSSKETCYAWSDLRDRLIFSKSVFQKPKILNFEDCYIECPSKPKEFLTIMFGNYMDLPSKDERTPKHPAIIDLNKSYKEYIYNTKRK